MAISRDNTGQVEGPWEELIKDPGRFAGHRVRITVLADKINAADLQDKVRKWLEEGKTLEYAPRTEPPPTEFEQILIEKFRKQGLVI
jgi:hypothetical protein